MDLQPTNEQAESSKKKGTILILSEGLGKRSTMGLEWKGKKIA